MTHHPTLTAALAVTTAAGGALVAWRRWPHLTSSPWVSVAVADGLFLVGFGVDELLRRRAGGGS